MIDAWDLNPSRFSGVLYPDCFSILFPLIYLLSLWLYVTFYLIICKMFATNSKLSNTEEVSTNFLNGRKCWNTHEFIFLNFFVILSTICPLICPGEKVRFRFNNEPSIISWKCWLNFPNTVRGKTRFAQGRGYYPSVGGRNIGNICMHGRLPGLENLNAFGV